MRAISTNEPTRYELIATNGERTLLVGYTPRKGRAGGLDMLRTGQKDWTRGELLARATGTQAGEWYTERGVIAATESGWTVKFSGRTQREVAASGELAETIYPED